MSKRPLFRSGIDYQTPDELSFGGVISQLKGTDTVQIWVVDKKDTKNLSPYLKLLSNEERTRAQKFRFEKDRTTFVLARGVLRLLLSSYSQTKPNKIIFDYGAFGKPAFKGGHGIVFNVSHSKELIVLAFCQCNEIGIDIEHLNASMNHMDVAKTVFSEKEIGFLKSLPDQDQIEGFFYLWTRKEALIKFLGYGLSMPVPLPSISVLDETLPLTVSHKAAKANLVVRCHFQSFGPKEDYRCALATARGIKDVRFMDWQDYKIP